MICCIFKKFTNLLTFIVFSVLILGLVNINYGLNNFNENAGEIITGLIVAYFGATFYMYINAALTKLNLD